jgi:hypothetical protein
MVSIKTTLVECLLMIKGLLFGYDVPESEPPAFIYEYYAAEIMNSFAEEVCTEFDLVCTGTGGGMANGDVEEMKVMFTAFRKATIEEARQLEVAVTEKFLQAINGHKKIRPYLHEYPFKPERAEISIAFKSQKGPHTQGVAYVFQVRNKIFYRKYEKGNLERLAAEPYEEALQKVYPKSDQPGV